MGKVLLVHWPGFLGAASAAEAKATAVAALSWNNMRDGNQKRPTRVGWLFVHAWVTGQAARQR